MKTNRIDVGQVHKAITFDCLGVAWWRVLVGDLLDELVETRRALDETTRSNDVMCDEIARCHGWLLHFNENGMVQDEAQMAVDGQDSPQCSPRRSTDDDVPPLEERVTRGPQESPDQIRARMLASNVPAEIRNAGLLPTRAELDDAGIAGLRDQARRWRAFLEMMRHTFDSVGPGNEEGWRCAGHVVAGMVDAALRGEEP